MKKCRPHKIKPGWEKVTPRAGFFAFKDICSHMTTLLILSNACINVTSSLFVFFNCKCWCFCSHLTHVERFLEGRSSACKWAECHIHKINSGRTKGLIYLTQSRPAITLVNHSRQWKLLLLTWASYTFFQWNHYLQGFYDSKMPAKTKEFQVKCKTWQVYKLCCGRSTFLQHLRQDKLHRL